jgi:spore coat protein CotF
MKNYSQNNNSQSMNQNSKPNYSNTSSNMQMSSSSNSQMSSSSNMSADDRAIMDNILSVIKGNCDLFMHGTIEASTQNVHQAFKSSLDESLQVQKEIFNHMSQKGWYSPQQAEQQKISQTKQKFSTT